MARDEDTKLALKLAEEEAEMTKSPADAIKAQLSAPEDSAKKNEEIKSFCVDWYHKVLTKRRSSTKITYVKIIKPSSSCEVIRLTITRDDASRSVDRLDSLVRFGIRTYRKTYNIVHTPAEEELIKNLKSGLPPLKSKPRSKKEDVFVQMEREGKVPDVSNLDLSLPTLVPLPSTTVINEPTHGIFFNDAFGQIRFFRTTQIPLTDTVFFHGIISIIPLSAKNLYVAATDELKKRDVDPYLPFE
ncbi:hypothetical protein L6452_22544 [Arctium lappa]|uniref:Uncharacterized protein n=1 Tax=Arctium lappa TaxID=4217 RepID=A0ACB9B0F6_ARCLA|nr:hypothetical protein L6452_22544 [Arctium lappa]